MKEIHETLKHDRKVAQKLRKDEEKLYRYQLKQKNAIKREKDIDKEIY